MESTDGDAAPEVKDVKFFGPHSEMVESMRKKMSKSEMTSDNRVLLESIGSMVTEVQFIVCCYWYS